MEESDQDSFGAFAVQSKGLAAAAAQRARIAPPKLRPAQPCTSQH